MCNHLLTDMNTEYRNVNPIIAPSILAADFGNLQRDIEMINESNADWVHVDVMDGMFVPNISFGIPICEAVNEHSKKPIDVHLMIEKPERYVQAFRDAGAYHITVHYEACTHLHSVIQQIREVGCKAGVALNPHTNVQLLEDVVSELDLVLIMSVNPGFGGQIFIENTYNKLRIMKELITDCNSHALIEVDGGVSIQNARKILEAGADVLVAGNFVFKSNDPVNTIRDLKNVMGNID
jgi:ribulose-phosphate 3-epimerase